MENEEENPLLEHEEEKDDDDDDDDGGTTNPFQPDVHSTPGPSNEDIPMTTMNREKEKGSGIAETSFIEGSTHSRILELDKKRMGNTYRDISQCEGHRTRGDLQQNREVTSQEVWFWQEGLSFVHRWKRRRRRTKVESNSPETNKICSWTRA